MTSMNTLDSGRQVDILTDIELRCLMASAWEACQGDDLRKLRAEAKRRGVRVI